MNSPVKPTLVCMVWRGGARFERCLTSIAASQHHFQRIILSITSDYDSEDMEKASMFQRENPEIEVLCTGRELPTMQHQAFWVDHLQRTGTRPTDWIYWLAYDDEVRSRGIEAIIDAHGNWPLTPHIAYFGPWAMRHEQAEALWNGDRGEPLESWTSFPKEGPTRLPVIRWIADQLQQPTYIQMSGSVIPFANYLALRDGKPTKTGPMRIEMATAACAATRFVAEFPEPVSIIYGRPNSDRASYGSQARKEDQHLMAWLAKYSLRHPTAMPAFVATAATPVLQHSAQRLAGRAIPAEEWRVRSWVCP